jgi:hypothetical protein
LAATHQRREPLLSSDFDIDSASIDLAGFSQPSAGYVTRMSAGVLHYTPRPDFNGETRFTYTVKDTEGRPTSGEVVITVSAVNDPPQAVEDAGTTTEDTSVTLDILANDNDPDGDSLALIAVKKARHGQVVSNGDGTVTYTPKTDYNGSDKFSYTISDGHGEEDTATVNLTIVAADDEPEPVPDAALTGANQPVEVSVKDNDQDKDGAGVEITGVGQGQNGSVELTGNGQIRYTPNNGFKGSETISYTIRRSAAAGQSLIWRSYSPSPLLTAQATDEVGQLTIVVDPDPGAITGVVDQASTFEDTPITIDVLQNDSGSNLQVIGVSGGQGALQVNPNQTIAYTPLPDATATDIFSYTVSDGSSGAAIVAVTITITPVNDLPVALDDQTTTVEEQSVTIAPLSNDIDVDGDVLDVSSVSQATNGLVTLNPDKTVTYTPANNFSGSDKFSYTISDGHGGVDTAVVKVTVTPVNDPPIAAADLAQTDEDTSLTILTLANDVDPDDDELTISGVTPGRLGKVSVSGNAISYQPQTNVSGTETLTYTISDGQGGSDTATVALTISPVNDAPVAQNDNVTTTQNTVIIVNLLTNDSDPEGDSLIVSGLGQASHGTVTLMLGGQAGYQPAVDFSGTDSFTYTLSDGQLGEATGLVSVVVQGNTGGDETKVYLPLVLK